MISPIAISIAPNDTGTLAESVEKFRIQPPMVRLGVGAAAGAVIGHFVGKKHLVIGALLGAAGAFLYGKYDNQ